MKINIEKIRIDGDTQSRESLKEATILDYTEKVLAGEIFKPIKIWLVITGQYQPENETLNHPFLH